ncbi:MAG: class I SAM-dependent methyltransferase [Minisyncoccia bacterium]
MAQEKEWDREYKNSKFLTKENKPQADVVRFVKWLKENNFNTENAKVLDLGCGTGRNSFYFAELGAKVIGIEISQTAINIAKENIKNVSFDITYLKESIGNKLSFKDDYFDILLDVTSSNSLSEEERETFLSETSRVLKADGLFFTKALCKDGDNNAKTLLKKSPGKGKDTYVLPDIGVEERVWSKEDFTRTYEKYFKILHMEKKTSYTRMSDRVYKRNFWIAYFSK